MTVLIGTVRVPVKAVTLKGHESGTRGLEIVAEAAGGECLQMPKNVNRGRVGVQY